MTVEFYMKKSSNILCKTQDVKLTNVMTDVLPTYVDSFYF